MSKNYKKKNEKEEIVVDEVNLSKKELYDLEKQKKLALKEKEQRKKNKSSSKKKKATKKTYQTNLGARIFAIVMLILMIASIIASAASYLG